MKAPKGDAPRSIHTIVLVDDDRFFRDALTEILTSNAYAVHTAPDGLEALALIREVKPDCIILDVVLPKLDGGQVCAAVRLDASLRQIPVIVFSALSRTDYTLFPDLSADAYVAKGPLPTASLNLLEAIKHFEEGEPGRRAGLILGYENLKSRRLVNELLLERRHLRALFEALAPGALELNPDGRIVMANPGADEILGTQGKRLMGEFFSSLLPPPDRKRVQDLLTEFGRSEQPTQCRTAFRFGAKLLAARLAPIIEGRICTGLVVVLEGEASTPAERG